MKKMLYIASREFKSYFYSPIAYMIFIVLFFILSVFFVNYLDTYLNAMMNMRLRSMMAESFNLNEIVLANMFWLTNFFLLFIMPIFTMKLFSEERKTGSFKLLMSSPLTLNEIIGGKFLGALFFYSVFLIISFIFPAILILYGNPEIGPIFTAYLGLLLIGAAYIAIGMFASAITEIQIISVVISFGIIFLLYVLGFVAAGSSGIFGSFLEYIALSGHIDSFFKGLIKSKDIIYFLILIFLGWFLTYRQIESTRWK